MRVLSLSATTAIPAIQLFQSQQQQQQHPLLRGLFPATRRGGGAFSISIGRQICFRSQQQRFLLFELKSSVESSFSTVVNDELQDFTVVTSNVLTAEKEDASNVLTAEKEEVNTVLTMFLRKQLGLSNATTATTISKSVPFIDHLVARLHSSIYQTRYLVGRDITMLEEIRDTLIPYLEHLREEHGDSLIHFMENFPNPPEEEEEVEQPISQSSLANIPLDSKRLKAIAQMTKTGTDGLLPPNTLYLLDIGLDMNQIKQMTQKYPAIVSKSMEGNIKPLVEFLLDLGVLPSNIPIILYRHPQLFGPSLSEKIIPSMAYFEDLGLDKSNWAKLICRHPHLLTYSGQKVRAIVDYFYEVGISRDKIGKVITCCPQIMGLSIDDNLRPTTEYFRSIGVNPTSLLSSYPCVFRQSLERKLKPVTEFFLNKGFSIEEIGTMASRFGCIYTLSLTKNLIPKWDFFLTMDYPRSEMVKYPSYFGPSLEGRIKPRYAQIKECGVKLSLHESFRTPDSKFEKILNRRIKEMLDAQHDSMTTSEDGK